ncbi:MAG: NADH-quinone oxidoreductase subunit J [Ammonifex sp.]|jgi:NADH-quinone oxidoreductase subunit J|nr:MAG: NADH-quinone oxidoreductase subunit J [Ammonifex sp.]
MDGAQTGAYAAFGAMTALVIGGGLGVVFFRNIFYAATSMVLCFLGVAGIYFSLQANFLAVMQVLIYIGAVAIMIVFAIMLTRRSQMVDTNRFVRSLSQLAIALAAVTCIGIILIELAIFAPWQISGKVPAPDITRFLGEAMMSRFAIPFEIAAVLLLVALIGAVMIALEEVRKS